MRSFRPLAPCVASACSQHTPLTSLCTARLRLVSRPCPISQHPQRKLTIQEYIERPMSYTQHLYDQGHCYARQEDYNSGLHRLAVLMIGKFLCPHCCSYACTGAICSTCCALFGDAYMSGPPPEHLRKPWRGHAVQQIPVLITPHFEHCACADCFNRHSGCTSAGHQVRLDCLIPGCHSVGAA